jgi:hypothetical protein
MNVTDVLDVIAGMPHSRKIFLALFLLISIGGGNYVFIRHNRRRQLPAWQGWNPFSSMVSFDRSDWAALVLVFALSMLCGFLAVRSE